MVMGFVIGALILLGIFVLSSLPLHFAVKTLGGKTDLLKTMGIVLVSGVIIIAVRSTFEVWGSLLAFLLLVWMYHEAFRLKWWKAFLVWFVQILFVALFWLLAGLFLGLALFA